MIERNRLWVLRVPLGNAIKNNLERKTILAWLCGRVKAISTTQMTRAEVFALEEMILDQDNNLSPDALAELGEILPIAMKDQWGQEPLL